MQKRLTAPVRQHQVQQDKIIICHIEMFARRIEPRRPVGGMAGGKAKYYKHLSDWHRAITGITGASVGAGRQLKITLDLSDALFDAGYELHVDAAVEDFRDSPSEVAVPLTRADANKPVAGRHYIQDFTYGM